MPRRARRKATESTTADFLQSALAELRRAATADHDKRVVLFRDEARALLRALDSRQATSEQLVTALAEAVQQH